MTGGGEKAIALLLGLGATGAAVAFAYSAGQKQRGTYLDAEFEPLDIASTGGTVTISGETDEAPGTPIDLYVNGRLVESPTLVDDEFSLTYDITPGTLTAIPVQLRIGTLSAIATVSVA